MCTQEFTGSWNCRGSKSLTRPCSSGSRDPAMARSGLQSRNKPSSTVLPWQSSILHPLSGLRPPAPRWPEQTSTWSSLVPISTDSSCQTTGAFRSARIVHLVILPIKCPPVYSPLTTSAERKAAWDCEHCSEANTTSPSHRPIHKRNSEHTADQKNSIKFFPLYFLKQDGAVPKYLNKALFFMRFPSHWEVISPGDPIKKPVLEQFTAQIYRSKKRGWFRLASSVLRSSSPNEARARFFSPVSCSFPLVGLCEGDGKWPQLHLGESPQLWRSLQLLWITGISSPTSTAEEGHEAPQRALLNHFMAGAQGLTRSNRSGVSATEPAHLRASSGGEHAAGAEGFGWVGVLFGFVLFSLAEGKNIHSIRVKDSGLHFT